MNKVKVFLTGGDDIGWALDEDLRLASDAIKGIVDLVGLEDCQVVHTVWWEGLNLLPREQLFGKWIVCHIPGEPFDIFPFLLIVTLFLWCPHGSPGAIRPKNSSSLLESIAIWFHTL